MMVEGLEFPDAEIWDSEIMPLARRLAVAKNACYEATMNEYSIETIMGASARLTALQDHTWFKQADRIVIWEPRGGYWKVQR